MAITQVSVEPNNSRTSQPKRCSAAAASACGSGAVAVTIPAGRGSSMPDSTSARRCTGVVTSRASPCASRSARATSSGKNGRPPCTAALASSGSSTDSSMPYMCCGGTVATTGRVASVAPPSGQKWRSTAAFCAVLRRRLPQVLGFAPGVPVLPEVKPIIASAPASTSGRGPSSLGRRSGRACRRGGAGLRRTSEMQ